MSALYLERLGWRYGKEKVDTAAKLLDPAGNTRNIRVS
jgi:hypothetical protein